MNLPPEQLLKLAGSRLAPEDAARIGAVSMEPVWALLAPLKKDISADWPALELSGHPSLSWIARDHTKRPPGAPPALVAHARAEWTRAHLRDDPAAVRAALLEELQGVVGAVEPTDDVQAHRWLYAKTAVPLGAPFLWDSDARIGGVGDWCVGGRVEGAIESGWALAARILPELTPKTTV